MRVYQRLGPFFERNFLCGGQQAYSHCRIEKLENDKKRNQKDSKKQGHFWKKLWLITIVGNATMKIAQLNKGAALVKGGSKNVKEKM